MADERKHTPERARDENPGAGEQTGEAVGGIGGTLAGAAIGSAAGPVGTIVGGLAGAVGGWWAGEKVGRAAEDWGEEDERHYREHFRSTGLEGRTYEDASVGYGVGHIAGRNPEYGTRPFEEVETDLREGWPEDERYEYDALRPYVREGYRRSSERRER